MKLLGPFFAVLIVIGALVKFFGVVALIVGLPLLLFAVYFGHICWEHRRDLLRQEREAITARADKQHRWCLAGDERAAYGEYPPARL